MNRYYHGTFLIDSKIHELKPEGLYEKINEETGCPEATYIGGFYIGFPTSDVPEISFSKSKSGAILGKGRWCAPDYFKIKMGKKECDIDVYETNKEPDFDISDCFFDFGALEEVRYRKKVPVEKKLSVRLSSTLVKQISKAYWAEWNEDWGETPSSPDTVLLACLKDHVDEELSKGKHEIDGLSEYQMDKCYADEQGISIEKYRGGARY